VLKKVLSNNAKWAKAVLADEPDFFTESSKGQAPEILWIGCSDSRVPETVTGSKPGDIFVHRNIANQFHLEDDSAQSVLSYGVNVLKIKHVVIVGHTQCGGAIASLKAAASSNETSDSESTPLSRWLAPLTELARSPHISLAPEGLDLLIEENIRRQVDNLAKTEIILSAWSKGEDVWIHGLLYDIEEGKLKDLGISRSGR